MGDAACGWRTVEHTADLAIEVQASSPEQLFVACAHALMGVLLGQESGAPGPGLEAAAEWRELALEAPDLEALLVEWLRELLYIQTSEDLLFSSGVIERLSEGTLAARVGFRQPDPGSMVQRELKGVTYHDLELRRRDGRWYARIVFDL